MKIAIRTFQGLRPRLTDNALTEQSATEAANCFFGKRDLRAWYAASQIKALTDLTVASLYKYGGSYLTADTDQDYCRSPISGDTYSRLYYSGQTELRAHCNDIDLDASPNYYKVNPTRPTAIPTATNAGGGSGANEDRIWAYSRVSKYGEEGRPSPITTQITTKNDDTVNITKIEAIPSDRQITTLRLYRTGVASDNTAEYYFVKDYTLPTIAGDWETGVSSGNNGEYWQFDDGSTNLIYKCIHDSTTQDPDDANYGVAGAITPYWEYYTLADDVATADLDGDICPSAEYYAPPANLRGLVMLPNGRQAGFVGNTVYLSEAYLPHAYPTRNEIAIPYDIVALGVIGTMLVVLTDAYPYFIFGTDDPPTAGKEKIEDFYPCVSKRSVVSAKRGVFYAAPSGLILVTQNGAENVTEELVDPKTWEGYVPASINANWFGERYFGFNSSSGTSFILDFSTGDLSTYSEIVSASHVAENDGAFYIVVTDADVLNIKEWEGDSANLKQYAWGSLEFITPLVNWVAAKVIIDDAYYSTYLGNLAAAQYLEGLNAAMIAALSLNGGINDDAFNVQAFNGDDLYRLSGLSMSNQVTLELWVENVKRFEKQVTTAKPFKLPNKFKGRRTKIKLRGYLPVDSVEISTSMRELIHG